MSIATLPGLDDPSRFQVAFSTRAGSEQKGPLAILWTLIESYQVDIFSVSLSRITHDFIGYMEQTPISLEEQADFTHTAARLLFYKSRLLLPNAVIGEDTPPDTLPYELVEQLLEYKKMQAAALEMRQLEERAQLRLTREAGWGHFEQDGDYLEVDLLSFLRTFRDFLEREEKSRPMQIHDETITVEPDDADAGLGVGASVALDRRVVLLFVVVVRFAEGFFEGPAVGRVRAEDVVAARFGRLAEEARGEVFVVKAI